jgi:hypothetical protein
MYEMEICLPARGTSVWCQSQLILLAKTVLLLAEIAVFREQQ